MKINYFAHIVVLVAVQLQSSNAENNMTVVPLTIAWIEKPPYLTSPTNGSLDNEAHGLIRDALLRHITLECGFHHGVAFDLTTLKVATESDMIDHLNQGKAQAGTPVFENPSNPRYTDFVFFKVLDYPGTDFITVDDKAEVVSVVLGAVIKSWPLLAVTITLTAISGVIMWALVSTYCCF